MFINETGKDHGRVLRGLLKIERLGSLVSSPMIIIIMLLIHSFEHINPKIILIEKNTFLSFNYFMKSLLFVLLHKNEWILFAIAFP